jgi:prepilin-type N-terminal cleavage/methylation domain-containing protein
MKQSRQRGFTLLELLLVIAIMAVLSVVVIIVVDPVSNLGGARNSTRKSDVNTILNAAYQYSIDNNGAIPVTIATTSIQICRTGGSCAGLIDLSVLTTNEKYLTSIPLDPTGSSTNGSGYNINKTANNRITVTAPFTELGVATISVTR